MGSITENAATRLCRILKELEGSLGDVVGSVKASLGLSGFAIFGHGLMSVMACDFSLKPQGRSWYFNK